MPSAASSPAIATNVMKNALLLVSHAGGSPRWSSVRARSARSRVSVLAKRTNDVLMEILSRAGEPDRKNLTSARRQRAVGELHHQHLEGRAGVDVLERVALVRGDQRPHR